MNKLGTNHAHFKTNTTIFNREYARRSAVLEVDELFSAFFQNWEFHHFVMSGQVCAFANNLSTSKTVKSSILLVNTEIHFQSCFFYMYLVEFLGYVADE